MKRRQSGMTLIGFVIVLALLAFVAFTAMKLVPAYTEFMGVSKALAQAAAAASPTSSVDDVRRDLTRKFDFQYVNDATIQPKNITIDRTNTGTFLSVTYDKIVPFIYNIDFLLHFHKSVPLQANVGP